MGAAGQTLTDSLLNLVYLQAGLLIRSALCLFIYHFLINIKLDHNNYPCCVTVHISAHHMPTNSTYAPLSHCCDSLISLFDLSPILSLCHSVLEHSLHHHHHHHPPLLCRCLWLSSAFQKQCCLSISATR